MKTIKLSLALIILLGSMGYSQNRHKDPEPYIAWVKLTNGKKFKGIMYSATKDSIVLEQPKTLSKQVFRPEEVQWLKIRLKHKVRRGAIIGAGSGALMGGIVAAVLSRESPFIQDYLFTVEGPDAIEPEATLGFVLGGAIIGTITGAAVTSKRIKYFINGDRKYYLSKLDRLQYYSLKALP